MAPTIVIVDDREDFRARAAELVTAGGYEVVGSCPDGRSALIAIAELCPDVVLLDVQLPDLDGFGVLEELDARAGKTAPVVVLVSTREAADYGNRIARSGAAGFISKADLSASALNEMVGAR